MMMIDFLNNRDIALRCVRSRLKTKLKTRAWIWRVLEHVVARSCALMEKYVERVVCQKLSRNCNVVHRETIIQMQLSHFVEADVHQLMFTMMRRPKEMKSMNRMILEAGPRGNLNTPMMALSAQPRKA